jgi:cytochrome c-type biogenesis protein CcmF
VAAGAVLLGTLYPLVLDALGMGKISVGPPYFESVFVPLVAPALFLMGVGPLAHWRSERVGDLARVLRWAIGVSLASAVIAPFVLGRWTPMIGLGLLLGVWITASSLVELGRRLFAHRDRPWSRRIGAQPLSVWGMLLAHLGVAVFVFGVTIVSGFQVERDLRMEPGQHTDIAGLTVRFDGVTDQRGPNYTAARGKVVLSRGGQVLATLHPERRVYTVTRMPMTETAIDRSFTRDLYVSLGEPLGDGAWSVRVYYKPLVGWIWGGCILMALGGLLAVLDRRYRRLPRAAVETPPAPAAAPPKTAPALARKAKRA